LEARKKLEKLEKLKKRRNNEKKRVQVRL